MKIKLFLSLALTLALVGQVYAQDTGTPSSTTTAGAQSGSSSGASSGSSLTQINSGKVQYSGSYHESVDAQVPMSVGAYGSFSQNNCVNANAGSLSTKILGINIIHGKPDEHCFQGVLSDQFGKESQLAYSQHKPGEGEDLRAMGVWASCLSDARATQMCVDMGKIKKVGDRYVPVTMAAESIPSHETGWNNEQQLRQQGITPKPRPVVAAPQGDNSQTTTTSPSSANGEQWKQAGWYTRNGG